MVHIICTKNDSNLSYKYWDMVPDGQKVRTDGQNGRTDSRTTQKYIQRQYWFKKTLIQQFIENQNNWIIMLYVIAYNKMFIIWNRSDAIYAK